MWACGVHQQDVSGRSYNLAPIRLIKNPSAVTSIRKLIEPASRCGDASKHHLVSDWMYVIARSRLTTPCTVLGMRTDMSINASLSVLGTPAYFSKRTRHVFDEFGEVHQLLVVKG